MSRLRNKKLLSWSMKILLFLVACAIIFLYGSSFKLGKAVAVWAGLASLVIIGGVFLAAPLKLRGQPFPNRWYRAAYRAGWILCTLVGVLSISAAVVWGITGPTLEEFPAVSEVLLLAAQIGCLVGLFVVGGLAATGWIAQGTEETRQWARSLGREDGEVGSVPAQEDTPPT